MTTSIDERVVSMRFDNSAFEQKVKTTLDTLKNLKNSLNFSKSSQSVKELGKEMGNLSSKHSLGVMAQSVQTISDRFSIMGIIGVTALQNITNQAVAAGQRIVSALTIDPVTTGFNEYELKMGSIQTIMASTGASLAEVNGYLDELNEYSDRTIYSFSDMTQNIGKFTNAGVKLEDAVLAIKGISNEAAISGANANEASRAMYNFAQALSSGSVKLIDWKSIELANMGTKEFKEQLLETAVALGTVTKQGEMYQSVTTDANGNISELFDSTMRFNDSLSAQWMTTDVLVETLKKYSDETTDIGKRAYASAQDIKTVSMLWDTLTEAAQSGWAMTWQILVGDFEEAKQLLTSINNIVAPLIDGMNDARNAVLLTWKDLGGRTALLDSFYNIFRAFSSVIGTIGDAFGEVFNDDLGQILYDLTMRFKSFTERLIVGDELLSKIKNTFKGFFTIVKAITGGIGGLVSAFIRLASGTILRGVSFISEAFFTAGTHIADVIYKAKDLYKSIRNLNSVKSVISKIASIFSIVKSAVIKAVDAMGQMILKLEDKAFSMGFDVFSAIAGAINFVATAVDNLITKFSDWVKSSKAIDKISNAARSMGDAFKNASSKVGPFIKDFGANASEAFTKFIEKVKEAVKNVKEFIDTIMENEDVQAFIEHVKEGMSDFMDGVKETCTNVGESIFNLFDKIRNFDFGSVFTGVQSLKDNIAELGNTSVKKADSGLTSFAEDLKAKFEPGMETAASGIDFFTKKYKTFHDFLSAQFDKIDYGALLAGGISGGMTFLTISVANTVKKVGDSLASFLKIGSAFTGVLNGITGTFTQLQNVLKAKQTAIKMDMIGRTVIKFAAAIAILTASIAVLTFLDQAKLKSSAITLGLVAGGLIALVGVLGILDKVFKTGDVEKYATVFLALSGSLMIVAASLKVLDSIDADGLWEKVAVIGVLAGIMTAVIAVLELVGKKGKAGEISTKTVAGSILAMAISLLVVVKAIQMLSNIDTGDLWQAVPVLIAIGAVMVALSFAMKKFEKGSSLALISAAASIALMAYAIKAMSKIDASTLSDALPGLIIAMGLISVLMIAARVAGQHAISGGLGIVAISASLIVIAKGIEAMAGISSGDVDKAIENMTKMMLLFTVLVATTRLAGQHALGAGGTIIAAAVGMVILAGAVMILAQLSEEDLAKATASVVAIGAMFALIIASTSRAKGLQKTLTGMNISLGLLVGSIIALSLLDPGRLVSSTAALAVLMGSLSLLIASTGKSKSAYGQLGMMFFIVTALTGIIMLLANVDTASALPGAIGMSALLIAMSTSIAILGTIQNVSNKALVSMAVLTLVIAALVPILHGINELDPINSIGNVLALSVLINAMSIACVILGTIKNVSAGAIAAMAALTIVVAMLTPMLIAINGLDPVGSLANVIALSVLLAAMSGICVILQMIKDPKAAVIGAVALDGVIAVVGTLMAAVGALVTYIPQAQQFIEAGIPVLAAIGEGLGAFFGGAISGLLGGVADGFIEVAESLQTFGAKLTAALIVLGTVPEDSVSKLTTIVEAVTLLAGASFLNSMSNLMNPPWGDSSMEKFGKDINDLAGYLKTFSEQMSEVNTASLEQAGNALKALTEATSYIDPSGGLFSFFTGEQDLSGFATSLEGLGDGLKTFGTKVEGISEYLGDIQAACKAIETIGGAQEYISPSGGLMQAFAGEHDLSAFGSSLATIGEGVKDFGIKVQGIGEYQGDIDSAVSIIQSLAGAQDAIDPSGGWMQKVLGFKDMGAFGTNLNNLADGLMYFATGVKGIGELQGDVEAGISTINSLAAAQDNIDPSGGWIQKIAGSKNLNDFGTSLNQLGTGIMDFAKAVQTIGVYVEQVGQAVNMTTQLQTIQDNLMDIEFVALKNQVKNFKGFVEAFNDWGEIDTTASNAVAAVGTIVTAIQNEITVQGDTLFTTAAILAQKIGEGFANASGATSSQMNNSMQSVFTSLKQTISRQTNLALTIMINSGKALGNAFASGISGMRSAVSSAVSYMVSGASSAASSQRGAFYNAGRYVAQGFAAGIRSGESGAINAAVNMAAKSYAAAKNKLDVNSPSRLFATLGMSVDEGFAKGMYDYSYMVTKASTSIADDAFASAKSSVDGMSNYFSKTNYTGIYTPNVVPVVDSSKFIASISDISKPMKFATTNELLASIDSTKIDSSINRMADLISQLQNATDESNNRVVTAIDDLKTVLNEMPEEEISLYVDSKKLASTTAKAMNRELGAIARRGGIA